MNQPDGADIYFRFEGTTYHLAALSPAGRKWLDAHCLGQIVQTVGINKIRRKAIDGGLQTLVNGRAYRRGYALQERPVDPDNNGIVRLKHAEEIARAHETRAQKDQRK